VKTTAVRVDTRVWLWVEMATGQQPLGVDVRWGPPQSTTQAITMDTFTEQSIFGLAHEPRSTLAGNAINANELEAMQRSAVSLSARERTIVLLMGHGLSNKTIARQLCIAPETVKSHAKSIFYKLTVQTRAQAVYRAATLGII
jgi:ATP/maltotriose-dependent transcriptional regulator MalT